MPCYEKFAQHFLWEEEEFSECHLASERRLSAVVRRGERRRLQRAKKQALRKRRPYKDSQIISGMLVCAWTGKEKGNDVQGIEDAVHEYGHEEGACIDIGNREGYCDREERDERIKVEMYQGES